MASPLYCVDTKGAAASIYELLAWGNEVGDIKHLNNVVHYLKATYLHTKRHLAKAEAAAKRDAIEQRKKELEDLAATIRADEEALAAERAAKKAKKAAAAGA
jgi:hypothetical protein